MPLSLFHLHGDLKDLRFPRLLAALREDAFTGVFQATSRAAGTGARGDSDEITREVHFATGHIAWAISTDKEESLRSYLLRNGTVSDARWAEAEEKAHEGTLRQSLIGLGIVNARELTQIEKGRAEEIVLALFSAREGEYRVRERQLSPGTPDLKIDPRPLILKGVLEGGDRSLILDEVSSLDTVYVVKRPALDEPGLSLPGEFQSVLRHIDGKRSIAQICSLTSLPDYFVCSIFAALSMIGAVRRNYEKTPTKPRGEIVKGIEVSPAVAAPSVTPLVPMVPMAPMAPMAPLAAVQELLPAPQPDLGPDLELEKEQEQTQAAPPPPISRQPFPGEGPITPLRVPGEDLDEVLDEAFDKAADQTAPEPPRPESSPMPAAASAYSDSGSADSSRPWFLLGGAAAVGFAVLFLILMAQNPGDAGEVIKPISQEVEQAPGADRAAIPPDEPPGAGRDVVRGDGGDASVGDTGAGDAGDASKGSAPNGGSATLPDTTNQTTPDNAEIPDNARRPGPVASTGQASILKRTPGGAGGRESLASGDYLAASRSFGREISSRAGQYTIQLLTACQDETVRRAVDNARGSGDLFILSTRLEGRNCYRVFWGRYPSQSRARDALHRDVPSSFLQDRNTPRITRLGG